MNNKNDTTLAVLSLIFGIVSITLSCCLGFLSSAFAIAALILGIIALVRKRAGKGMAITGIALGGLSVVYSFIALILLIFSLKYSTIQVNGDRFTFGPNGFRFYNYEDDYDFDDDEDCDDDDCDDDDCDDDMNRDDGRGINGLDDDFDYYNDFNFFTDEHRDHIFDGPDMNSGSRKGFMNPGKENL